MADRLGRSALIDQRQRDARVSGSLYALCVEGKGRLTWSQVFSKTPALDTTKVYWARRRGEHSRLERTAKTRAEVGGGGSGEEAGAGRAGSNALCFWDDFRCAGGVPSNVRPLLLVHRVCVYEG